MEILQLENIRKKVNSGKFNAEPNIISPAVRLENQHIDSSIASKAQALRSQRRQILSEISQLSNERQTASSQISRSGFYGGSVKADKARMLGKKIESLNYKLNSLMREYEQLKDQFGYAVNGKIRALKNCALAKEIIAEKTKLSELEKQMQAIGKTVLANNQSASIIVPDADAKK